MMKNIMVKVIKNQKNIKSQKNIKNQKNTKNQKVKVLVKNTQIFVKMLLHSGVLKWVTGLTKTGTFG